VSYGAPAPIYRMASMIKCEGSCGRELKVGDKAYEQVWKETTVIGTKVNTVIVTRIVCVSCAEAVE